MHKGSRAQSKDRAVVVENSPAGLIHGQRTEDPKDLHIKRNGLPRTALI